MTDKKKVSAAVVWDAERKLLPVETNWMYVMQICHQGITDGKKYVILPVEESQDFKPQRRKLTKGDKASPLGLIQRDAKALQVYYPYAAARFDIAELSAYAAIQFNAMTPEDLERMAQEIVTNNARR